MFRTRGAAGSGLIVAAALLATAAGAVSEPLRTLLADEDYEMQRPAMLRELERGGAGRCARPGMLALDRNERVREHAVRLLADAGCRDFADYRPFLGDASPWVKQGVLRAAERHLMRDAVPVLIEALSDRRLVVTVDGSWTVAAIAHRALRAVTCQSFHFDPAGPAAGRADAAAQWTRWHAAHLDEPREAWVAQGIALAHDYLGRDLEPHRLEGLELLALIGPPGFPHLRAALARSPQDLRVTVSCLPDEPPRVLDRVPCVLELTNASARRVAIVPAPGDPAVRLTRLGAEPPRAERPGAAARSGKSGPAADPAAPAVPFPPGADAVLGRVVDLAPGGTLRRGFTIGPVGTAGRYEVRATLSDLAAGSGDRDRASTSPPIEATTLIRFEQ